MCMIWLVGARICQQKKGGQQEKVSCKLSISELLVHLTLADSEATCSAISHQVKMKLSLNQDSDIYRKLKRDKRGEKGILLNLLCHELILGAKAKPQGQLSISPSPQTLFF